MDGDSLFEEVDVTDEHEQLTRVSENLAVLDAYYDEIAATGGIGRDQAKALVNECGVLINSRYPPQSFTDVPSRTNLSVAMEGMVERTAQLLWELLKKAAELLMKTVQWVVALIKTRRITSRNTARKVGSIQAVKTANDSLKETGVGSVAATKGNQHVVDDTSEDIEQNKQLFNNNFNDLVADILTNGKFCQLVRWLGMSVFDTAPIIRDKLALFDHILRSHSNLADQSVVLIQVAELNTIATPIDAVAITEQLRKAGLYTGHEALGMLPALRIVFEEYLKLRQGDVYDVVDIDTIVTYFAATDASVIAPFLLAPDEVLRTMEDIERQLHRIHGIDPSNAAPQRVRTAFQGAVKCLTDEIYALRLYINTVEGCSVTQDRLCDDVWKYEQAVFSHYRAKAAGATDSSLVERVNEIQSTLKTSLQRFH